MLCIQPWQSLLGIEWRLPLKAAVLLEFHAEKRIWQTSEVVVIDAGVQERSRQAQGADVLLNLVLGHVHWKRLPAFAKG